MRKTYQYEPEPWEVGSTYDPDAPISIALDTYIYKVLALRESFGKLAKQSEEELKAAERDWKDFRAAHPRIVDLAAAERQGRRVAYDAPPVKQSSYLMARRRLALAVHVSESTPNMMLLELVAGYDAFLANLLRAAYKLQPLLLKSSDKPFTWQEVADLTDIEALRGLVVEREAEGLLRNSHVDQLQSLASRLGISTLSKFDELREFVELTERRNLVAHAGGRVSLHYIRQCSKYGLRVPYKPGETLDVGGEYFREACNTMLIVGVMLSQTVWRAVGGKEQLLPADNDLSQVTYTLLVYNDWALAQRLLGFALHLKEHSTEQRRLVFKMNYAQTFKWLGNQKACVQVLDSEDWEARDLALQISYAVLTDDFERAGELMRHAAITDQVKRTAFDHWPIYREFRSTRQFRSVYEEVYHEPYEDGEEVLPDGSAESPPVSRP